MSLPRIVAMLNWFNEDPEWLHKGITSLGKVPIDHVVAADGAYRLYPNGAPSSPSEQKEAIERACRDIGATCDICTPVQLWEGGEVEKRTHLFRMAEQYATPHEDWYMVWDADEVLGRATDVKARLERTDLNVGDITAIERPGPDAPTATPSRFPTRKFYRAIPGIYVDGNHYTYRTPDGRYLWGNQNMVTLEQGLDLKDVQVAHKTNLRAKPRKIEALRYYEKRDKEEAELSPCARCGAQSSCTVRVNHSIERIDGVPKLTAGTMDVCAKCFPGRARKSMRELELLGINPNTLDFSHGYALLP